jgi:hypothetical protein
MERVMARGITGGAATPTVVYRVMPDGTSVEPIDWLKLFGEQKIFLELGRADSPYQFLAYKHATIVKNAPLDLLFLVFDKKARVFFEIMSPAEIEVAFYESPNIRRMGEQLEVQSFDRTTSLVPRSGVFFQPVIRDLGQELISGTAESAFEWVLAPLTMYLIRGINRASKAQTISTSVVWEEIEE